MNRIAQIARRQCEAAIVENYENGFLEFTPISVKNDGRLFRGYHDNHGFLYCFG